VEGEWACADRILGTKWFGVYDSQHQDPFSTFNEKMHIKEKKNESFAEFVSD
jgi:hypothetical protein